MTQRIGFYLTAGGLVLLLTGLMQELDVVYVMGVAGPFMLSGVALYGIGSDLDEIKTNITIQGGRQQ